MICSIRGTERPIPCAWIKCANCTPIYGAWCVARVDYAACWYWRRKWSRKRSRPYVWVVYWFRLRRYRYGSRFTYINNCVGECIWLRDKRRVVCEFDMVTYLIWSFVCNIIRIHCDFLLSFINSKDWLVNCLVCTWVLWFTPGVSVRTAVLIRINCEEVAIWCPIMNNYLRKITDVVGSICKWRDSRNCKRRSLTGIAYFYIKVDWFFNTLIFIENHFNVYWESLHSQTSIRCKQTEAPSSWIKRKPSVGGSFFWENSRPTECCLI